MGSLRVGHDWATSLSLFTFMYWRRKWQPNPVFLPGESQGWGSLVGCRLWGRRVGHDWSDLAAAAAKPLSHHPVECVCLLISHLWLCDPIDNIPPGSSVRLILQARILECVAIPSARDLPDPGIESWSPTLQGQFFTIWATRKAKVSHPNWERKQEPPPPTSSLSSRRNT